MARKPPAPGPAPSPAPVLAPSESESEFAESENARELVQLTTGSLLLKQNEVLPLPLPDFDALSLEVTFADTPDREPGLAVEDGGPNRGRIVLLNYRSKEPAGPGEPLPLAQFEDGTELWLDYRTYRHRRNELLVEYAVYLG